MNERKEKEKRREEKKEKNDGRWFGGGSSERGEGEAELVKGIGSAAPLQALWVPAPARSEARAESLSRRKTRLNWLRLGEAGFSQAMSL